jgi:hypothetical protein
MNHDWHDLIQRYIAGTLPDDEALALQNALKSDKDLRALYLDYMNLDVALGSQAESRAAVKEILASPMARETSRPGRRYPWLPLTAAAAIVLLAFIVWPRAAVDKEAISNGVAMVSDTLDAAFAETAVRSGDTIAPGKLTLNKGLAQIEFFSGATVLIEGATQLEIISAWEARCVSGRVRVHVPPAAKGFLMHAPDVKLEDLGTEFALNVNGQDSAVHVFDGEVIAHTKNQAPASLKVGMSLASTTADLSPQDFLPISELQGLIRQREQRRLQQWQTWSEGTSKDPRLIAYYTFQHAPSDRWDRLVSNFAAPAQRQRAGGAGGAVGAKWTQGRWPGKDALEFKRPGDRVRMNLDGSYSALTLSCWVKVDSVDKKYNALLLTDGYDNGKPHWQIYEDGSLMFTIMYRPDASASVAAWNQMYFSRPVFSADSLGRWHHIAVSYDNQSGQVVQYFDGVEVSREVSRLHQPGRPITFGPSVIGNWGLPTGNHPSHFPIRNLNGAIDEFAIYSAVLSAAEIQSIFANGKPE